MYHNQPAPLAALKDAVHQNVSAIRQEMLLNAMNDMVPRLTAVLLEAVLVHIESLLQLTLIKITYNL